MRRAKRRGRHVSSHSLLRDVDAVVEVTINIVVADTDTAAAVDIVDDAAVESEPVCQRRRYRDLLVACFSILHPIFSPNNTFCCSLQTKTVMPDRFRCIDLWASISREAPKMPFHARSFSLKKTHNPKLSTQFKWCPPLAP